MSLPTTQWVAQRRLGKKLYADAVSNRIEWLQRVANRKAFASAYVRYADETDGKEETLGATFWRNTSRTSGTAADAPESSALRWVRQGCS
jgi:hypothetical protein